MCCVVFRCGPLLSAGTASASSRSPLCGVFRHVLFPQESTVLRAKHYVSEGNTRRLQRESEDDETPQRALFASEEAHREPAERVVYFLSGSHRRLNQKNTKASISIMHPFIHQYATSHYIFSAFGYTND